VPIEAGMAADALVETLDYLTSAIQGGWAHSRGGAIAVVTGVPVPTLNGVFAQRVDADAQDVEELLHEVAATGLPHCLQFRPDPTGRLAALAARRRMVWEEDIPLMALEDTSHLEAVQAVRGLTIRVLSPTEAELHARVAASGFEAPVEMFLQLMTPAVLGAQGATCYLGEADGHAVTTGFSIRLGSYVAIFNIATPPDQRRRGYGAAGTARAVADGMAAGAKWSWLQASAAGYPIYERLGFHNVESWPCWISTAEPDD
jgi:hypothetical protein